MPTKPAGWIKVWDLPTRVFHWLLAVLILMQYGTAEWHWLDMQWHFRFGYALLALLLFRLAWGLVGSHSSRFAHFVHGPARASQYFRDAMERRSTPMAGHNPLGGWSVVALLACLAIQATTGLFASDGISVSGPLNANVSLATAQWLTTIHTLNKNLLLALIALHIGTVLAYLLSGRENLVAPMLHGYKRLDAAAPRMVSTWLALLLVTIAALAVWAIVT